MQQMAARPLKYVGFHGCFVGQKERRNTMKGVFMYFQSFFVGVSVVSLPNPKDLCLKCVGFPYQTVPPKGPSVFPPDRLELQRNKEMRPELKWFAA